MNKKSTTDSAKRSQFDITPERFVAVWNAAATAQEAADTLGMPKALVQARASKYRKAGVKLKEMSRGGRRRLDVEGLNRLIAQVEAEQARLAAEGGSAKSKSGGESPEPRA